MLLFMPLVFIRGTKILKRDVLLTFVYGEYKRNVHSQIRCLMWVLLLPYHNKAKHTSDSFFLFSQDKNLIQQSMQSMFVVSKKKKPFMALLCISISTKEPFTWHICMIVESFLGFFLIPKILILRNFLDKK